MSYQAFSGRGCLRHCSILLVVATLCFAAVGFIPQAVNAQAALAVDPALMKQVFPGADSFSAKEGVPPVYRAYSEATGSAAPNLIGYLFETPDLPPEQIGYSAPIEMLVGMDLEGTITGMKILYYRESYRSIRGDFLATERFPNQFADKNIIEGFRVGRDIDGVSRATISSWAVSRGIRNAARRVAQTYLNDSEFVVASSASARALQLLQQQTWQEMTDSGLVNKLIIPLHDFTELHLSFAFLGHDGLGELLVGVDDYSRADREASSRVGDGYMVLVGIAGDASMPFRQERLAVRQDDQLYPIIRRRFVYVGSADHGKIANQVRFAGAMILDEAIDISRSFNILYDTGSEIAAFENSAFIEYQVPPIPLALAQGTPISAELLASYGGEFDDFAEQSAFVRMINNARWSEVAALLLLLAGVMTAFLRKSTNIRWLTLGCTFIYLGFINGTFLSISHLTNAIKQGPALFLNDLPLLIIVVFTLVTTLLWGRVFCSSLCPFGALQDIISRLVPRHFQKNLPQAIHDKAIYIKYVILAVLLVMSLSYSEFSVFQYFEPFGTLFYFSQSVVLWIILIAFILASTFIKRFYCRYACPLGASLGVLALVSPWRIKRVQQCQVCKVCEHACPTGAIRGPDIDFKECVRCDVCETKLIARSGVCKHSMEEVTIRIKHWSPAAA